MRGLLSFLGGAVMGALVGATLALLLTPASGESLRNQMRERIQLVQTEVREAAATRRADLEHQLSELRTPRHS